MAKKRVRVTDTEMLDWLDKPERSWTFWLGKSNKDGYTVRPVFPGTSIREAIQSAMKAHSEREGSE